MPVNIDTQNYFASGEISFQDLKNNFGGGDAEGKNIKFSDYVRDTSDNENPIVPDSTENSDITDTEENLSIETFRNSNKYYHVKFTGIEAQKEFQSHFNNNLTKNIPKKLNIGSEDGNESGQLVSGDTSIFAAKLTANGNVRNMNMNVNAQGIIYGAGGSAGASAGSVGGSGGGALHLNTGNASRNFNFTIKDGGKIWAGGGGGSAGSGSPSRSVSCNLTTYRHNVRNAYVPPNRHWEPARSQGVTVLSGNGRGCGRKFRGSGIPGPGPGYNTSGGPMRGWWSTTGRGGGGNCANSYTITYDGYNYQVPQPNRTNIDQIVGSAPTRTLTAPGGIGGAGGQGQGWTGDAATGSIQSVAAGGPGVGGGSVNCSSQRYVYGPGSYTSSMSSKVGRRVNYGGGSTSTNPGNPGGPGGEWGKKAGGEAGDAIKHNGGITFSGTGNSEKLKGRFSN